MGFLETIRGRFSANDELRLAVRDEGHGFDRFGANADWVSFGSALTGPLHQTWFRVDSHGVENLPSKGPAILVANHSGTLPYDAAMIWADVLKRTHPPRIVRAVMDLFVPKLPFLGTLFVRTGAITGSRANVERALEAGELLLIFPEGTTGIGKPYRERYRLQSWRVGHAELAIRRNVPIIPTAVIGAEEQMPQITRIERGIRRLGAPYLPIALTPLPLPVRYHIYYGEPLDLASRWSPAEACRPCIIEQAASLVRDRVQSLIDRGVAERKGMFS